VVEVGWWRWVGCVGELEEGWWRWRVGCVGELEEVVGGGGAGGLVEELEEGWWRWWWVRERRA